MKYLKKFESTYSDIFNHIHDSEKANIETIRDLFSDLSDLGCDITISGNIRCEG